MWFLKEVWKLCAWYGAFSTYGIVSFLAGREAFLECQYCGCSEKWVAFVLGKFILSKFIGKQMETINNRFCMLKKTNVRQDQELLCFSKEGRQVMGQKVGISSSVRKLVALAPVIKGMEKLSH